MTEWDELMNHVRSCNTAPEPTPEPTPEPIKARSYPKPQTKRPLNRTLERWAWGGYSRTTCRYRCRVEPDGECSHGHVSWLRYLGYA